MKSKSEKERLPFFVYGTLLPGQPNAYLWEGAVTKQESAVLEGGRLYDMGSYPMLVEEGTALVYGTVIHPTETGYDALLARLDELEGCNSDQPEGIGYSRVVREVQVENGRSLSAWVYIGQKATVQGLHPIPGGDWYVYVQNVFQNTDQWLLDVASKHGLSKD